MTALDFLCNFEFCPMHLNGNSPTIASNSERRRWLQNRSVLINGKKPNWNDEIEFPITQLVFFPKSNRKTTMM